MENIDFFADSHTDFLTELKGKNLKNYLKYLKNLKKIIISCAIFTTKPKLKLNKVIKLSKKINKINGLFLSIEDLGFIKNTCQLLKLLKLKPLSIGLTWNYQNQFGGGANSNVGLSTLGKKTIKIIEDNGVLIDTAHMNRKTFYQFAKITKFPLYNSHSNIYSLHKHSRNLTNKQIKMIKDTKGFLGLTIYQNFISKIKISATDIANQIDYLIKNFGDDFFGFGLDLYGFNNKFLPTDINTYSDFKIVYEELIKLGYNNHTINKIFYLNYKNFLNKFIK